MFGFIFGMNTINTKKTLKHDGKDRCTNCGAYGHWFVKGYTGVDWRGLDADVDVYHCTACGYDWCD